MPWDQSGTRPWDQGGRGTRNDANSRDPWGNYLRSQMLSTRRLSSSRPQRSTTAKGLCQAQSRRRIGLVYERGAAPSTLFEGETSHPPSQSRTSHRTACHTKTTPLTHNGRRYMELLSFLDPVDSFSPYRRPDIAKPFAGRYCKPHAS
jgi:hypothetical protein